MGLAEDQGRLLEVLEVGSQPPPQVRRDLHRFHVHVEGVEPLAEFERRLVRGGDGGDDVGDAVREDARAHEHHEHCKQPLGGVRRLDVAVADGTHGGDRPVNGHDVRVADRHLVQRELELRTAVGAAAVAPRRREGDAEEVPRAAEPVGAHADEDGEAAGRL